jgi:hypothetical protein
MWLELHSKIGVNTLFLYVNTEVIHSVQPSEVIIFFGDHLCVHIQKQGVNPYFTMQF